VNDEGGEFLKAPQQYINGDNGNISQVSLVKTVRLPANSTTVVPIQTSGVEGTVMLEPLDSLDCSLQMAESLIEVKGNGLTTVVIANTGKTSQQLKSGTSLGKVVEAELIEPPQSTLAESLGETSGSDICREELHLFSVRSDESGERVN